jgi:hypothetical protein
MLLPRFVAADKDGFVVGLALFDASQARSVAEVVNRCNTCTPERLRATLLATAHQLRALFRRGTLEISSQPTAQLSVDGELRGSTPWRGELAPGYHRLALEANGARVERDITLEPGRTEQLAVTLEPLSAAPLEVKPRTRFRLVKWVAFAAGLASVAVGAGLWALDGRQTCALAGMQRQCPQVYDTLPVGASLVGVGGALLIATGALFVLDRPLVPKRAALLAPLRDGATVAVEGRF